MSVITTVPQWEWTLISTNASAVTLNNLYTGYNWYYQTTLTGEAAPTAIVKPTKPTDAVRLFQTLNEMASRNNLTSSVIERQTRFDLYVYCYSQDNKITKDGQILVKEGEGNSLPTNPVNGGVDVNVQDQTTPTVIQKFNQVTNSTTLAVEAVQCSYLITVASNTGIVVGSHLILFSIPDIRFSTFDVLAVNGNDITVDSQIDVAYPIGTFVDVTFTDMAVNGSVTPQIFGLRGLGVVPGIDVVVDITRIIMTCYTTNAVNLSLFGDLAKLTRGLLLRDRNGQTYNVFNVKSNGEIAGITLDWIPYALSRPNEGQNGFTARLTFASQGKLGVVKRLHSGQDLEFIVQDDLSLLESFEIYGEGHVVD